VGDLTGDVAAILSALLENDGPLQENFAVCRPQVSKSFRLPDNDANQCSVV